MNLKQVILVNLLAIALGLVANEFTVPKSLNVQHDNVSAKKTREAIMEELGEILKNLLKNDQASLELRAFFQKELEHVLYSDELSLIESSSKSKLQENLKMLQEANRYLIDQTIKIKELIIKAKKLKTGKLKG